jgi:SagB-type dehydrogenase family enzyme
MKSGMRGIAAGRRFLLLLIGILAVPASGCRGDEAEPYPALPPAAVVLPAPSFRGEISLEEAIQARRAVRSFSPRPLALEEVSQLLWAAGGKTVDGVTGPTRSYPSAGGIYPLSILLAAGEVNGLAPGIYRYGWEDNSLRLLKPGDHRAALARSAYGQDCVARAPVSIVIVGDIPRTAARYGERGENRYVSMDAGHSGQNVSLQALALGLGSVIVGAFEDNEVKEVLGLEGEIPFYLIPVGHPVP